MRCIASGLFFLLLCFGPTAVRAEVSTESEYQVVDTMDIDTVPSWFPVGFSLLTHGEDQYAAYYNKSHQMMIAHRKIGDRVWQKSPLPSKVGWDSHNYITLAQDATGNIHLSGNMHGVPLIYFKTRKPGDITTFEKQVMTGKEEQHCTYPRFLKTPDGTLLYMYRSGGSGNGRRFYNQYDVRTETWSRLFDSPLFEGEGKRNAYPIGPLRGPTGLYHLVWVWRDTPDCATNHHLSHTSTRDFKTWTTAGGQALELPITLGQTQALVDPIPSGGGIINGCERLIFDSKDRPTIAYHKRDKHGHMQIFVARFEEGRWSPKAVTAWDKKIPFSGRGAMPFIGIRLGSVRTLASDLIAIDYRHRDYGSGRILLDEATLRRVDRQVTIPVEIPKTLTKPTLQFDGIRVKIARDLGESSETDRKYMLRWETLEAHHDRPRQPPLPPASILNLITLERAK
jgi:hypothetical protein